MKKRGSRHGLRSYRAAMKELGNAERQEIGRHANNRAENSHANVHNHFNHERHLVDCQTYKQQRFAALAEWQVLAS